MASKRILIATIFMAANSIANAGMISITQPLSDVELNDSIEVTVDASGLSSNPLDSISAFDLIIDFDSDVLSFTSIVFGGASDNQLDFPEIGGFGFFGDALLTSPGALNIFAVSGNSDSVLDNNQADSFSLFSLFFNAEMVSGNGGTTLGIDTGTASVLDSGFSDLANLIFNPSTTNFAVGTTVPPVTAVPEPPIILLLLAGLPFLRTRLFSFRMRTWSSK